MARFHTLLEEPAARSLAAQQPVGDPLEHGERETAWLDLKAFLVDESDVTFNADPNDVPALLESNPYFRILYNKKYVVDNGTHFRVANVFEDELKTTLERVRGKYPWVLLMVDDQTLFKESQNQDGVPVLSTKHILDDWSDWRKEDTLNVGPGKFSKSLSHWDDLRCYCRPLTSLVVCDRYLLANSLKMESNLLPMVGALLPGGSSEFKIDVMFISEAAKMVRPASAQKSITKYFRQNYPSIEVEVSVAVVPRIAATHDRHIYTNCSLITSGNSFSYFVDGKILARTYLSVASTLRQQTLAIAVDKLALLAKSLARATVVVGSPSNRLLDAALEVFRKGGKPIPLA